jgi:DNA polymerase-3 subunit gamma/tau
MAGVSTLVLARKYRPRNFAQMAGQEHVVRALGNALRSGRLHHAYLFTGTRGIGKTTVSRILAKSLNCTGADGQGGITAEPCGVCSGCTQIDADRYIDYIELDAASNRSIDEIRDLIERAAYKPSVGRFKVFMIDEAHQLTKDAFNALLKTLEEPPDYLKFVLATTDPEKMLPTVLSRCLQFNLRPLSPEVVRDHLAQVLQAEAVPHDEGSLRLLGRAARGSMRDALSLADQAIAYGAGQLEEAAVRAMLGAVDGSVARTLVHALAAREPARALETVQALRESGQSVSSALEQVAVLLQQMAVEQAVPGSLAADDAELADARELARALAPDETQLLYSIVLHGRHELHLMPDEYSGLAMTLLRFHAFVEPAPATPAVGRGAAAALRVSPPPARAVPVPPAGAAPPIPAPAPQRASAPPTGAAPHPASAPHLEPAPRRDPAPPQNPAPRTVPAPSVVGRDGADHVAPARAEFAPPVDSSLGDRWQQLVTRLVSNGRVSGLARELALQGALVAAGAPEPGEGSPTWTLEVEHEPLRGEALADKLREAIVGELGSTLTLRVVAGPATDSPARREAAERARRQQAAEQAIQDDPVVRDLLTQFPGARIVPGSIRPA